jgi:aminoglycoside phosphotransferase (APT) family kinase protein
LRRIAREATASAEDVAAVERLATYLAELHAERPTSRLAQSRSQRDLLGSGEGIFGIVDSYPADSREVPAARLRRIEELCHGWRWRLKEIPRPLVRTHGDFHPFNVLFDARRSVRVLGTSRGSMGDAADDVTCMAVNFPFFALERPEAWKGALAAFWYGFFRRYLERSGDDGILDVAAPFLAWRGLVLASPVWYPNLAPDARRRLLDFVEATLEETRFRPESVEALFQ